MIEEGGAQPFTINWVWDLNPLSRDWGVESYVTDGHGYTMAEYLNVNIPQRVQHSFVQQSLGQQNGFLQSQILDMTLDIFMWNWKIKINSRITKTHVNKIR